MPAGDFMRLNWRTGTKILIAGALLMAICSISMPAISQQDEAATLSTRVVELYRAGQFSEAIAWAHGLCVLREKALGADHPDVATSLISLAGLYREQGHYGDAEPLYRRSLAIYEKALGPDHPYVATSLNNLAELYNAQGRHGDAEPLYQRSLAIYEKALGADHPDVATSLNNLAELYRAQGRYGDAEPLYRRSLAIHEKALGADHPDVAASLNNLAELYRAQGRFGDAMPLVSQTIARDRANAWVALPVLFGAQGKGLVPAVKAQDDALTVVQRAARSAASMAVNKLAVRLAAGSDRLAQLVRQDQDLDA